MSEEELTRRLAGAAAERFARKLSQDRITDPALRADLRRMVAPWVRARRQEGCDLNAMHDLVEGDQLLLHRGAQLLRKHYPRLMAQQVVEVIEDAARRGELVADEGGGD